MQKSFSITRISDTPMPFEGDAETGISVLRVITEDHSDEMGGGYMRVNGAATVATLPNDELAVCLNGTLKLTVDGVLNTLEPGDFAWIPKGTTATFDGENAMVFWAAHPVDWRTRNG